MKKKLIYSFILIISTHTFAQKLEETNTIEVNYNVLSRKSDFPKPFSYNFETALVVNDSIAQYVFKRKKKIVRHRNFQVEIGELTYVNNYNFRNGAMEEQRILGKDKIRATWTPKYDWKITSDTKVYKGYTLRKATTKSIEIDPEEDGYYGTVTAWFCEDIPLPVGPDRYCGLPGLIMEIEYENTPRKVSLKSINYESQEIGFKNISNGIMLDDKRDVIYYRHYNPNDVNTKLRQFKRNLNN